MIFYVSSAVFAGLVSVLAYVLYTQKKREGISYRAAIYKINNFAQRQYGGSQALEQFCEDYNIEEKGDFLKAISGQGHEILFPQTIAKVLNKIGYSVRLVNKVYYLKDRA